MTAPVPVHLITGFLGSGKTTLLRRILAEQPAAERLVVLVNEFGELGIDGQLLQGFDSEVMELTSGCICCVLKADFISSLTSLIHRFLPQRIVVEATGLAETGELSKAVQEIGEREDVFVASVAAVVDAEIFLHRDMMGPLYFNQIKAADLLLLNKIDLVSAQEVEAMAQGLTELNPEARIMPVVHCAVERETILAPLHAPSFEAQQQAEKPLKLQDVLPDLTQVPGFDDHHHHHHNHTDGFISFNFQHDGMLDPDRLNAFLAELPWDVFRLKGFVRFPSGVQLLNYTYRRPDFTPSNDPGPTRLVFIGWGLEPEKFFAQLDTCVIEGKEK